MKKPAPTRAAPAHGGTGKKATPGKTVPAKKAAPKKPAAKKPGPGAAAAHKAHVAHVAHLAHLAHLGIAPPPAKAAPKPRQLALGDGVACCAAEALAASLRLTGRRVGAADVLALYERTASDPDTGASIVATLEAASECGLAGVRPVSFAPVSLDDPWRPLDEGHRAVILGVDLPGPHTVLDDGSNWWSWGELYDLDAFPGAVIEEAWTLGWPE